MEPRKQPRNPLLWKRIQRNFVWLSLLLFVWLMCSAEASAQTLRERQQAFPNWQSKPPVRVTEGDLIFPKWMAGTWRMSSTLVGMVAPLAPEIVTPEFEGNRQFLPKPIPAIINSYLSENREAAFSISHYPLPALASAP